MYVLLKNRRRLTDPVIDLFSAASSLAFIKKATSSSIHCFTFWFCPSYEQNVSAPPMDTQNTVSANACVTQTAPATEKDPLVHSDSTIDLNRESRAFACSASIEQELYCVRLPLHLHLDL
ncbi:acetyl-CoA acetyltransferase [Striga asiatica]|uniref:Acetyl-CoA acetyltransferase n=1 Tax=Striga asiatica TaxID=4170 RepID=A0A5A7R1B2_STRAF|nr:acetyl-CoA acetyltransferase [Striga asiatica]